jgi:hypothetical protein
MKSVEVNLGMVSDGEICRAAEKVKQMLPLVNDTMSRRAINIAYAAMRLYAKQRRDRRDFVEQP